MNKIIEGAKLVEIDKSKKYVIVMNDDLVDYEDIMEIGNRIREWLNDEDSPLIALYVPGIQLLEAEKDD